MQEKTFESANKAKLFPLYVLKFVSEQKILFAVTGDWFNGRAIHLTSKVTSQESLFLIKPNNDCQKQFTSG